MSDNVIPLPHKAPRRCVVCGILLGPFRPVKCEPCERWEAIRRSVEETKKLFEAKDA